MTEAERATNYDTMRHIERVRNLLNRVVAELLDRGERHDQSKLAPPEVGAFTEYTGKLATCTYGSEEYKGYLAAMKPALDHHYANNRHHPEHYPWHCPVCSSQYTHAAWVSGPQGPNESGVRYCPRCCRHGMLYESELMHRPELGVGGMNLIDVVEMLCDWKAASERHNDGDIRTSITKNADRFRLDPQLVRLLENTADLFWA